MIRIAAVLLAVCATAGLGSARATPTAPSAAAPVPVFSGSRGRPLPGTTPVNRGHAAFLKAGPHRLDVYAWGPWTVRIVKGIERPQALGGGLIGFRGNGARELPPFTTKRGTKLVWTNNGALFRLESGPFSIFISSQAKRGARAIPAGLHEYVINALGTWTLGWKP